MEIIAILVIIVAPLVIISSMIATKVFKDFGNTMDDATAKLEGLNVRLEKKQNELRAEKAAKKARKA